MHSGVQKVVASTNMLADTAKVVDEARDLDATIMFVRLHSLKVLASSALNPMESWKKSSTGLGGTILERTLELKDDFALQQKQPALD